MSYTFGLTIESMVAILLLLTIIYCARLNSRLERLRKDEGTMKTSVAELVGATEAAERAIAGLKATLRECNEMLDPRLRDGEALSDELEQNIKAGEAILAHLRAIAQMKPGVLAEAPAPTKPTAPDTRAMVAAAKAFAERTRTRSTGFAA
ncbi:MAG TPA: DUF6468 domain-containing protein [Pseudorhodoplanes sp.]|nr:DUF6468 domain-containing protein [Pseudorhodoplanes sp.]